MRGSLLMFLLVMLMGGCASGRMAAVAQPADAGALPEGTGWWAVHFSIDRPEGEEPRWHIDALLGGEVIAPVFERRFQDIMIWRIHRRAGDDSNGHVFSFIFYGPAEGARRVYADIAASRVLQQLQDSGVVPRVAIDDVSVISRPDIGDTSDRHWDPSIRQTWPALAMGASRMWLDLVALKAQAHGDEPDLDERYRRVQEDITALWAAQGQHAILHHLAGIYAYQPLLIRY
jgi:hypothetical protein